MISSPSSLARECTLREMHVVARRNVTQGGIQIVLSRKGFDSSAGGHASPILPDGTMVSLPIPSTLDCLDYGSLRLSDGRTFRALIDELNARARVDGKGAHLDPDLVRDTRP